MRVRSIRHRYPGTFTARVSKRIFIFCQTARRLEGRSTNTAEQLAASKEKRRMRRDTHRRGSGPPRASLHPLPLTPWQTALGGSYPRAIHLCLHPSTRRVVSIDTHCLYIGHVHGEGLLLQHRRPNGPSPLQPSSLCPHQNAWVRPRVGDLHTLPGEFLGSQTLSDLQRRGTSANTPSSASPFSHYNCPTSLHSA